jgi:hypothetical protein
VVFFLASIIIDPTNIVQAGLAGATIRSKITERPRMAQKNVRIAIKYGAVCCFSVNKAVYLRNKTAKLGRGNAKTFPLFVAVA